MSPAAKKRLLDATLQGFVVSHGAAVKEMIEEKVLCGREYSRS